MCLEAAAQRVPTVCFDAGGIPEFVRQDAGIVVPFPDLDAMGLAVALLASDERLRNDMGETASKRVREENRPSVVAPPLLADLIGRP